MEIQNVGAKALTLLTLAAFLLTSCSKQPTQNAWPSSASMVIESGASIGPVRSGMTMEQVIAELGKPADKETVLKYPHLGFHVLPARNDLVGGVICLDKGKLGPDSEAFAGRTKEGIGIGSSRADIINAYGEPTTTEPIRGKTGAELLRYKPLGLDFKIEDGKVYLIGVFFNSHPTPDRP